MKKLALFLITLVLCASPSWASLHSVLIEYRDKDSEVILEGYLAYDDSFKGPRPGVLVVHEWWGLNDFIKQRADRLAKMGYIAFAPDIYGKGVRPQTPQEAGAEAGKYKQDRALFRQRVNAGLDQLKVVSSVDARRLAAIGYCFGGTAVLELARSGADVQSVVSFHGGLDTPVTNDDAKIKSRILVLHGADDPFVPQKDVDTFKEEMSLKSASYRFIAYPGAVHGFTNPANKGAIPGALYNAKADKASWRELSNELKKIFKMSISK